MAEIDTARVADLKIFHLYYNEMHLWLFAMFPCFCQNAFYTIALKVYDYAINLLVSSVECCRQERSFHHVRKQRAMNAMILIGWQTLC